jgi:hypothetical protein
MTVRWHDLIEFLRCVSKIQLSVADKEFILRFSQREVPWVSIAALAEMEGVAGLVYHHLKDLGLLGRLPTSFTRQIENSYRQIRENTVKVIDEAKALSKRFEQMGIPVVALQGFSLLSIYKDPGLRPLSDVDLMVKRGHKEDLTALLQEEGYHNPIVTYPDIFYKDGIKIDIHTHLLNLDRIGSRRYLFPENLSPLWERAVPFFKQSDGLLIPDPFDNLIALATHALKHSYSRMIWLVDIHESLLKWASGPDGWKMVVERALSWHQERVFLYVLILLERIFLLKIPYRVKDKLGIHSLNIIEKRLLSLNLRGFKSRELCYALWFYNIKGAGNKIRFFKETVFPRDEIMAQIFDHNSSHIKGAVCAKRFGKAIAIMGRGLIQALHLSYRSTGNE